MSRAGVQQVKKCFFQRAEEQIKPKVSYQRINDSTKACHIRNTQPTEIR